MVGLNFLERNDMKINVQFTVFEEETTGERIWEELTMCPW